MIKRLRVLLPVAVLMCSLILSGCSVGYSFDKEPVESDEEDEDKHEGTEEKTEKKSDKEDFKGGEYATAYLGLIKRLYNEGKADSYMLLDVDGDNTPELAAVESEGTYDTKNAYLYTFYNGKAVMLKSLTSGLDGAHIYISKGNNRVYCTGLLSGNEHNELYSIQKGQLVSKKVYDLLCDTNGNPETYKINDSEVSADEYYDDIDDNICDVSYTAIDYDGLKETDFSVIDKEGGLAITESEKIEKYRDFDKMSKKLIDLGASEEIDADLSKYKEAYKDIIKEYYDENAQYENENGKVRFGLVYFDGDEIPELVAGLNGYFVSLYTYDGEAVVPIFTDWGYGAGGNAGYDFLPGEGVIYNLDNDYAGVVVWETFLKWDPEAKELKDINNGSLYVVYAQDLDGDGHITEEEMEKSKSDEPHFYYRDEEISQSEYQKHRYPGEYEYLVGEMTYEEITEALK